MGTATKATRTRMYDIIHEETGWPYIKIRKTSYKTIKKTLVVVLLKKYCSNLLFLFTMVCTSPLSSIIRF
jgi:hypothetical protein